MWNKILYLTLLITIVLFGDFNFINTELSIYESYSRSLIDDGDLNISNQLFYDDDRRVLSNTGYYYSHHNYGSTLLTTPMMLFARNLGKLLGLSKDQKNKDLRGNHKNLKSFNYHPNSLEVFESFVMGAGVFILTLISFWFLVRTFTQDKILSARDELLFYNQNILFLLSGPALYYLGWAQSTPNLLILFPLTLIFYYSKRLNILRNNFFLGVSFGLGFLIRNDFALYGVFILLWWNHYHLSIKKCAYQALGLILSLSPFVFYEVNRLGEFDIGYFHTFYLNWINIVDFYFSAYGGVILTHPVVILLIVMGTSLILTFLIKKKWELLEKEIIVVLVILILKSVLLSLTYSHSGGVLGPRQLIQDVILLSLYISCFTYKNIYMSVVLGVLAIYNLTLTLCYANLDLLQRGLFSFSDTYSSFFIKYFKATFLVLTKFTNILNIPNLYNTVLVFVPICITLYYLKNRRKQLVELVLFFVLIFNVVIVISDGNASFDREENRYYTKSLLALMYYENIGSMLDRINYLNSRNRYAEASEFKNLVQSYHENIKKIVFPGIANDVIWTYYPELGFDNHLTLLKNVLESEK